MIPNGFLVLLCVILWSDILVPINIGCKLIFPFLLNLYQNSRALQCNLPINLFNELIFLIIWTWFIFLSVLTFISFILCVISIYTNVGHTCIRRYLHMSLLRLKEDEEDDFIDDYLRWDGILVLRIIAQNTNDIIMANLVGALFKINSNSMKKENNHNDSYDQIQPTGRYLLIDH